MSSSRYTLTACGADGVIAVHEPLAALAATEVQVAVDYSMAVSYTHLTLPTILLV